MFKIVEKKGNKYGVKDTKDGVVEWYTANEILAVQKKFNLKIDGIEKLQKQPKIQQRRLTDLKVVTDLLLGTIKRKSSYDYESVEIKENNVEISFRWWGDWVIPADADEDEMDYDWKILDKSWGKIMQDIINKFKKDYPDLKFSWSTGEKDYIYIDIIRK